MTSKLIFRKCLSAVLIGLTIVSFNEADAQKKKVKENKPLVVSSDGKLSYSVDSLGNRIPDFSYAGYMAGERAIPNVPVKVVVPVRKGDATWRIQSAINYVSSLKPGRDGIRGAVLLGKGIYELSGNLLIHTSGVVLRGSGMGDAGTILLGTGKSRETLISIKGKDDRKQDHPVKISNSYVPVNSLSVEVTDVSAFKAGDFVTINRPSTQAWIEKLGTAHFGGGITALGWKPGDRDMQWDRRIVAVKGHTLVLDAPLTTAIDATYGGGTVSRYVWEGRISQTGVENLICRSAFDSENLKDEDHRWMAIVMENIQDGWVRQVRFEHFAGSAVEVLETAKRITIEDCKSLSPVSEIGGQRRYTFFTLGQQTLFQRCYAEYGYHDFAVGFCATGPNVFVQCESHQPYSFSGTIDSWASGVLFDVVNVEGQALSYLDRGQDAQGAGWSGANSVFYQCSAARIDCFAPPTANNWAFGCWAQFSGNGYWENSNEHIQPRSLYYAQLSQRIGPDVLKRAYLLQVETEASSSPQVDVALALTKASVKPHTQLGEWIDSATYREPVVLKAGGAKSIDQMGVKAIEQASKAGVLHIENGWIMRGRRILTGNHHEEPWWRGTLQPVDLKEAKPAITRFVPGRTGNGLTDDLDEVTNWMIKNNIVSLEHNYGLWYERRRDDHERIKRMDGEVWPPFYELPFARSGQGTAWDGLSKYDLTKYDNWYWSRLKQFADLADQKGLVLVHQNYFQHNIIEAGAHYADFPWRTANNINNTGFPEPPPYAGDKRIFMAEQFYDITNPTRRTLHRAYIRQCLDNFATNNGVIQLTGAEFTGPLHFVKFWLDVVKEWEQEKGRREVIGLSTTKDVQDAILADPGHASTVDVIDIRYWHYQADGSTYAPQGGLNLAPRQHARLLKPKRSSFEQVYRAVSEYRTKYPNKAVMYSGDSYDSMGWAVFMGGGSLANIPSTVNVDFLTAASSMHPLISHDDGQYVLAEEGKGYIIFSDKEDAVKLDLQGLKGNFIIRWVDPGTGKLMPQKEKVQAGTVIEKSKPATGQVIMWVSRI